MSNLDEIERLLQRSGHRLTGPRRAVATLIGAQSGHFTAEAILQAAIDQPGGPHGAGRTGQARADGRTGAAGRATVFRTLELLERLGAIERLDLPSGQHAWVACDAAHHHHIVCRACGRNEGIDGVGVEAALHDIGTTTGFQVTFHRLELFGICPACQAGAAAAS